MDPVIDGLWFAVVLTGVVNPRYRFVFEPFCLLYLTLGLVFVGGKVAAGFQWLVRAIKSGSEAVVEVPRHLGHVSSPRTLTKTLR